MWNKLKQFLFPTEVEGFKFDAVDKDGDGKIQEGTPFERKVATMKTEKKAPAAKKSPAKKTTTAKKTAVKKTVKKSTPKKK